MSSSAKQQHKMTKFYVVWRTGTAMANFRYLIMELNAVGPRITTHVHWIVLLIKNIWLQMALPTGSCKEGLKARRRPCRIYEDIGIIHNCRALSLLFSHLFLVFCFQIHFYKTRLLCKQMNWILSIDKSGRREIQIVILSRKKKSWQIQKLPDIVFSGTETILTMFYFHVNRANLLRNWNYF